MRDPLLKFDNRETKMVSDLDAERNFDSDRQAQGVIKNLFNILTGIFSQTRQNNEEINKLALEETAKLRTSIDHAKLIIEKHRM